MQPLDCSPWPRACLQVYTGNGKGKTTAAFGLALRAAGRGLCVYIGQFMKGQDYGEYLSSQLLGGRVNVERYGSLSCIGWKENPDPADVERATIGLNRSAEALTSSNYSIVILDEINVALHYKLVEEARVLELVDSRPEDVELICTGRYAPSALIERAHLVTEMREIKHPFNTIDLTARDGIER